MSAALAAGHRTRQALQRLRESASLAGSTSHGTTLLMLGVLTLAAVVGVATIEVADLFADRPLFLLALPMIMVLVVALVIDARALLLVIVLSRATLNPVFDVTRLPVLGGLGSLLNIGVIALALLLAIQSRKPVPRVAWLPWLPFLAIVVVNVVRSPDWLAAQREAAVFFTYAAVYYAAFHCVRDEAEFDTILRWFLLSALPVFAYTIGHDLVLHLGDPDGRLKGPLPHPNILGFYLVVNFAAWLAKTKATPGAPVLMPRRIGWWCYLLLLLALLAGTQSRGAWVGALVVVAVYGVFFNRASLVVLIIGVCMAMAVPEIRDRALDLTQNTEVYTYSTLNSYAWRKYLWASALAWMSPTSYVAGNGLSSFIFYSTTFFPLAGGAGAGAHNAWLELLFELGLVGVGAYLALFALPAWLLWTSSALLLSLRVRVAFIGLIAGFAFMSYGDNMLAYLVVNWPFWFVVGVVTSFAARRTEPTGPGVRGVP